MLYLHTLGGVYLSRDGGPPMGGAAGQRRLLGLLSVLSVAGDRGISRDRLVALLWPDSDEESGRHSLTQALYHARRTLGCENLIVGGADVRLTSDGYSSDVRELETALERNELAQAIALYAGPFLDGFAIAGNGAFERWAESQRSRLQGKIAKALETLAARAATDGDLLNAVELRRRVVALDPLDSNATRRLLEVMLETGDRSGALRQAQIHETLVRSELGVAVDPAIRALAANARRTEDSPPSKSEPFGGAQIAAVAPPVLSTSGSAEPVLPSPTRSRTRGVRRVLVAGLAAASVFIAATIYADANRSRSPRWVPQLDQSIVVAPFRVSGADPALSFLREGLVELLSIRLGDEHAPRSVDAGAVLRAWRRSRVLDSTDVPRNEVLRLAHRFGATGVVVGSVVGDTRHLVITASLVQVGDSAVSATVTELGPADSLAALVDRVAVRLLAARAGESERLANRATPSLNALRAYLAGRIAYREGAFASAMREYERALRSDSTFALAAMHLALSADRLNAAEQHEHALSLAWANRADLSDADRLHLIAVAGPRYPQPSTESEQLAAWEAAVAISPDRVEALTELAERIVRIGPAVGVANPERRASALLRHVLDVDSTEASARNQLALLAARAGSVDTVPRQARSKPTLPVIVQWRVAQAARDSVAMHRLRQEMPRLDDRTLRGIGMVAQFDAIGGADAERALRIRALRARRAPEQLDAILAQHSLALNQGRPLVALDLSEQLEEAQPGSRAHLRLRVLDALYGNGDRPAAERAAAALSRFVKAAPMVLPSARAVQLADACVLAQWRMAEGQLDGIRAVIAELRAAGLPRDPVPVGPNPHMCAELLDASYAVATRARGATARVGRLDSLMFSGPAAGDATAYAHLVAARLYEQVGEPRRALDVIRRRAYMDGWPRYLATARRMEGRLATLVGDRAGALAAYRAYLALRSTPELQTAAEVAGVRGFVESEAERPR